MLFLFSQCVTLGWMIFLFHIVFWDVVTMMWRGPAYSAVSRFFIRYLLADLGLLPSDSYGQFMLGFPGVRCGTACTTSGFALRAESYSAFATQVLLWDFRVFVWLVAGWHCCH